MKKTTAFFLIIGVLALIIGGSGSIYFYNKVDQSIVANGSHEEYTLKKGHSTKEATINLKGNAHYTIQTDNSDKITMENQGSRISTIKSSLNVKESDQKITVDAEASSKVSEIANHNFNFSFSFFSDFEPPVIITIPSSIEKLTFKGNPNNYVTFTDIDSKELSVDFKNTDVSFNSIISDTMDVSMNNGDLYLNQVKGDISLNLNHGSVDAYDLTGSFDVQIDSGDFRLSGRELPKKLTVLAKKGDISIDTEEILYDISINAKSGLGDVSIFDNDHSTYKNGTAKRTFDLESRFGDISVDGPSNDYDDDFDD
ncbi:DUF4097 family beta strand repeat-containing protein [Enterococcus sp. LJL99]